MVGCRQNPQCGEQPTGIVAKLLTPRQHRVACWACVAVAMLLGAGLASAYNTLDRPQEDWPWTIRYRTLVSSKVPPGGWVTSARLIDYHEDCDIRYERKVVSRTPSGRRYVPPDTDFEHPPWDLSGVRQETSFQLPPNFPCGPAYMTEDVSAACNLLQRYVRRLRKPTITTPFEVTCPAPATAQQ